MTQQLIAWLDERLDLGAIRHFVSEKSVPVHRHSVWYYMGGITLFLVGVQVATGILLLLYYRPSAGEAYESVKFIVSQVEFGWLIRNLHSWSANLLILMAFVHLFSTLFLRSYRKPRELTWVTGVLLLFIMMGFGFSGYLLPWNELAFFATKVGTGIAGAVPFVGDFMVRFLRGGDEVTGATLTRFYGLHVAILPAMTTVVLGMHLLFIQRQGMSVPPSVEAREKAGARTPQIPFFPHYVLHDVMWWYVALAVLAALALFLPWELGTKADAFAPVPAGISLPMMTFSFSPRMKSERPWMAASVSTRVVSWNDAADSHESVASDALVMPMSSGRPSAGFLAAVTSSRLVSRKV